MDGASDLVHISRGDVILIDLSRVDHQIIMSVDKSRDEFSASDDRIVKKYRVQEVKEEAGSYSAILEDGREFELFQMS